MTSWSQQQVAWLSPYLNVNSAATASSRRDSSQCSQNIHCLIPRYPYYTIPVEIAATQSGYQVLPSHSQGHCADGPESPTGIALAPTCCEWVTSGPTTVSIKGCEHILQHEGTRGIALSALSSIMSPYCPATSIHLGRAVCHSSGYNGLTECTTTPSDRRHQAAVCRW
jgi:hypothetical protein